jgi:hypothetical protein
MLTVNILQQHVANVKFTTRLVHCIIVLCTAWHIVVDTFLWAYFCHVPCLIRSCWLNRMSQLTRWNCDSLNKSVFVALKIVWTPMCFPCVWMFDSHFFASPHCDGRWRWNCGCISQGLHSKKHMQLTFCVGILLWNLGYLMPGLRTTGCWHIGIVMLE